MSGETQISEWRPVVGYEGLYEVSSIGEVRSLPRKTTRGCVLRQHPNRWGYLQIKLVANGISRTVAVYVLVTAAFLGPRPPGLETRHLDGRQTRNCVSNLRYGTKSENAQDRLRHGYHNFANKTHCPQGHAYDSENTRRSPRGDRYCLTCKREKIRAWRARRKVEKYVR
jgi:hypothetical protein